ncbi:hypothetical protein ABZP36_019532 [Zizania latifolia]
MKEEAAAVEGAAGIPREGKVRALPRRGNGGEGQAWEKSFRCRERCVGGLTSSSSGKGRLKRYPISPNFVSLVLNSNTCLLDIME